MLSTSMGALALAIVPPLGRLALSTTRGIALNGGTPAGRFTLRTNAESAMLAPLNSRARLGASPTILEKRQMQVS